MSPRRVLHLTTTLDRGGAEKSLLHLCRAFASGPRATRWECAVAYLKGRGELAPEFADLGVPVADLGLRVLTGAGALGRARRLASEFAPDVLHTHLFKADCLGAAITRRAPRDSPVLVSTKHNQDVYLAGSGVKAQAYRAVARRVARRADLLISISDGVAEFFARTLGPVARRTETVPYGLPAPEGHPDGPAFRRAHGVPEGVPLVLCVARLDEQKDHRTLLEAFANVGGSAHLVLLGLGPLEPELRARAGHRVRFAGFTEDPADAYAAADVLVLASRHEGLGLVLLEAALHGVPAVATRVGGIPDVVQDGTTGLLVAPSDPAALAAALQRVLADPELRASLGAAARKRALATHSVESYAAAHERLYDELLEARS